MQLADVPSATLQCVAGVGGTDLAVVALRVGDFTVKVFGIEDALRILDCGKERLEEDIEADVPANVLDA